MHTARDDRSAILDNSAGTVVKYAYDAFGNCKVLLDTAGLSTVNPIRYRVYTNEVFYEL